MDLPLDLEKHRALTRRHFFGKTGLGLGSIALQGLLGQNGYASGATGFKLPAKAKSVIYLHMAGSPSQIDLFEHKPALTKFHGVDCPQEYLEGKRFAFIKALIALQAQQWHVQPTRKRGSGIGLADACRPFNQDRFAQAKCQENSSRDLLGRNVADGFEARRDRLNRRHGLIAGGDCICHP